MESGGKKRTSILTRILLACLLPVAVVFAILLFLTAKALYEEASDSAKNTAALFSDHVTEMVKTNFLNATGSLAFVAKNLGVIAKSGSQTLAESGELLRMFLESNPSLYCAWFAFEPGVLGEKRFTRDFVRRDEAIVEIFDLTDELLTDETRSPWYSGALKSGEPYFDSVGFYDYGEGPAPVFTVSFPIKIDDRVVGVVGMDALYGSFYRGLGALKIPGSREIALLSVDARVLYSTHKEDGGETGGRPPLKSAYDREKLDAVLANGKYYAGEGVSPISGAPSYMSIYPVEIENARQPIFLHVERPASVVFGRARGLVRTLLAAGAVLAVLLGCCVYLATRRVTGALKLLTDKADAVADGDYDIHFDPGKRDGKEIARLQTSLAEMADCLKRNGQERRVFVEALTSKVAQRNRTIYEVNLIASNLDVRAEQIIDATRTLHRATESNAAEIDGIAASSVDIKDSSMEHAESAESGLAMADAAYRDTEHVAREAKNVSDLIGSVHESGNRAGEIVRTINDLSFQTALLAINATIEAARAGSKGNSFTIVADEVKRLANRSARAAEATGDVIKTMTARIDDAYEKIDNLCAAISDARDNIRQLREITGSVAKVASEQTSAVSAIITSLEKSSRNMDAVVSVSKSTAGIACSIQEYSSALRQTTNDDLDDIVTA